MRDIRFRGKRVDTQEWVYGDLCHGYNGRVYIVYDNDFTHIRCWRDDGELSSDRFFEVTPESVGQYTGLKDKNGVEVYEGDTVTANWYDYEELNSTTTGETVYCEGSCAYRIWDEDNKVMTDIDGHGCYAWDIEVIGNKWDNPELLEVQP